MAEEIKSAGRGRALEWVGVLVVGLPLLYFLSTGPVILILEKTNAMHARAARDFVITFYAPLIWAYENTPLKMPLEFYLSLWGVK